MLLLVIEIVEEDGEDADVDDVGRRME